jgi:hypothetical protein
MPMAAIAPAVGLGGSLLGGLLGSRQTQAQQDALNQQTANMKQAAQLAGQYVPGLVTQGQNFATQLGQQGQGFLGQAQQGINPAMQYWQQLLGGNRQQMTSALAPEIQNINQQYNQALQSQMGLTPRQGGSAATLADLPYQRAAQVSGLMNTLRPQAASQLGQIGLNLGQLGSGLYGQAGGMLSHASGALGAGGSLLGASSGSAADILSAERQRQQQAAQLGSGFGSSLFNIMQGLSAGRMPSAPNVGPAPILGFAQSLGYPGGK